MGINFYDVYIAVLIHFKIFVIYLWMFVLREIPCQKICLSDARHAAHDCHYNFEREGERDEIAK